MVKRKPTLTHLPIEKLVRGKYQPRQYFDQEKLRELAESIKSTDGLLQPIVVRPNGELYEIVAGERRWRAAMLAGLTDVSCLVHPFTDEQSLQAAIIENINRTDLNPIEEAKAYQRLIDEFNYLHEEIAASVGKSRTVITNSLRLLKLDQSVQTLLEYGKITEGHGKILAGIPVNLQKKLAELVVTRALNVRQLELEAKKLLSADSLKSPYSDANVKYLEMALSKHIGNRVQIDYQEKGGGYLHIRFNNIDELEGHFDRIGFKKDAVDD